MVEKTKKVKTTQRKEEKETRKEEKETRKEEKETEDAKKGPAAVEQEKKEVEPPAAQSSTTADIVMNEQEKKEDDAAVGRPADAAEAKEEEVVVEKLSVDERERIQKRVEWNGNDSTINVLADGGSLALLGAPWCLLRAGIRADTGIKNGTYTYEVKIHRLRDKWEVRLGFSTLENSLIDDTTSECAFFSFHQGKNRDQPMVPLRKGDVIAVRLSRSEKETSMTVFVNGELRPFKLDEPNRVIPTKSADAGWFPHIMFHGATLVTNFREEMIFPIAQIPLRMMDDCAVDDVARTIFTTRNKDEKPTVIVPLTLPEKQDEWIQTFLSENPHYFDVSPGALAKWATNSGMTDAQRNNVCAAEVADLLRFKDFIMGGPTLTLESRQAMCKEFRQWKKICKVQFEKGSEGLGGLVSLPSTEEGFDEIEYIPSKEECEEAVAEWNDRSKKLEILKFKTGEWFDVMWQKYIDIKKELKDKPEYAEWSKEDWLLADLRVKVHYVMYAFKEDVNDPERPSFALSNLPHYCQMYKKALTPSFYGVQSVEDFADLVPGMWKIEDGVMVPLHPKDTDVMTFIKMNDEERQDRFMRLEAGDEAAKLTFASGGKGDAGTGFGTKTEKRRARHQDRKRQFEQQEQGAKGQFGGKGNPNNGDGGERNKRMRRENDGPSRPAPFSERNAITRRSALWSNAHPKNDGNNGNNFRRSSTYTVTSTSTPRTSFPNTRIVAAPRMFQAPSRQSYQMDARRQQELQRVREEHHERLQRQQQQQQRQQRQQQPQRVQPQPKRMPLQHYTASTERGAHRHGNANANAGHAEGNVGGEDGPKYKRRLRKYKQKNAKRNDLN